MTAASVTDNAIGIRLLDRVAEHTPAGIVDWGDTWFKQDAGIHGAGPGIDVQVVNAPTLVGSRARQEAMDRRAGLRHP